MNLELLKSHKDWYKYFARQEGKVEGFNLFNKNLPYEYPCLVYSYIIPRGLDYELKGVFVYKKDAKKLLKIKQNKI